MRAADCDAYNAACAAICFSVFKMSAVLWLIIFNESDAENCAGISLCVRCACFSEVKIGTTFVGVHYLTSHPLSC